MWPYWVMFAVPAFFALSAEMRKNKIRSTNLNNEWMSVIIVMTLLIGYRFEVGGDWGNYLGRFDEIYGTSLDDVWMMKDPGYNLISWLSIQMEWGIYGVNLFGGAVFSTGLVLFCLHLPRPWLALAVAIPYLLIVVAMGYSRQAIALGFAMLGLVQLERNKTLWFVFYGFLGATFHKSAVLLLPIAALVNSRNRYWTIAWVTVIAIFVYQVLLKDSTENLYGAYVEPQMQSSGALIRLLMNAIPSLILLRWLNHFQFKRSEAKLWLMFAYISSGMLGLLMFTSATTALDRMALYLLPLQLVVFSHFPEVFGNPRKSNDALVVAVLLYYTAVEFVWLNYADNAYAWIPYRFYPLEAWF